MYNIPYFKEGDEEVLLQFAQAHPFAFLTGCDDAGRPVATQVPVFVEVREGVWYLTGHIMKNTDHHKAFVQNPQALCVFTGAHSYVSATWYSNPHQASTWNYLSVHVRGQLHFLNEEELIDVLRKTTLHFEGGNTKSTTHYDNLSEEYTSKLIKAIVAFEIKADSIENVFKLSQNRDEKSFENIIDKLQETEEGRGVADEMKKRQSRLFPKEENDGL